MESWSFTDLISVVYFGWALTLGICGHDISPHVWPFARVTFPHWLFCQVSSSSSAGDGYTQLAGVYFWFEKEVWVGRKLHDCFFFFQWLMFEVLEDLKYTLKKKYFQILVWERLRVCKRITMNDRALWHYGLIPECDCRGPDLFQPAVSTYCPDCELQLLRALQHLPDEMLRAQNHTGSPKWFLWACPAWTDDTFLATTW